jgi:hypothetical protein
VRRGQLLRRDLRLPAQVVRSRHAAARLAPAYQRRNPTSLHTRRASWGPCGKPDSRGLHHTSVPRRAECFSGRYASSGQGASGPLLPRLCWNSPLPHAHPHRDWAHPAAAPATSAPGLH